jgi:hypothetical protein
VVHFSDFAAQYGGGLLHVDVGAIRRRVEEFDAIQSLPGQVSIFQPSVRRSPAGTHAREVKEVMIPSPIGALLDARDALVRACLNNRLGFGEFLAAYGDFPASYGLDDHSACKDQGERLQLFRKRIAFHMRVAGVLSGLRSESGSAVYSDVERFLPAVGLMRLRGVAAEYPRLEVVASG